MQKRLMLSMSLILLLSACGGGGSSDTSSGSSSGNEKVGYLVDSAVLGVEYLCGDRKALTQQGGKFVCEALPISFFIGSTNLGSIATIPDDQLVFPQDIVGVDRQDVTDPEVLKLATLLQSLDSDGNTSNGIHITEEIRTRLTHDTEQFLSDLNLDELINLDSEMSLVEREAVVAHLSRSVEELSHSILGEEREAGVSSTSLPLAEVEEDGGEITTTTVESSPEEADGSIISLPDAYRYPVINNRGINVEGSVGEYTIRIYSTQEERADPQSHHTGVVVRLNDEVSENMPIQASYLNQTIRIALYDQAGSLVKVSDEILVSDEAPLVIVELTI